MNFTVVMLMKIIPHNLPLHKVLKKLEAFKGHIRYAESY